VAGANYGKVRRSLEELEVLEAESVTKAKSALHDIKKIIDSLSLESPELPNKIIDKFRSEDA
jgi:hypothetical protein